MLRQTEVRAKQQQQPQQHLPQRVMSYMYPEELGKVGQQQQHQQLPQHQQRSSGGPLTAAEKLRFLAESTDAGEALERALSAAMGQLSMQQQPQHPGQHQHQHQHPQTVHPLFTALAEPAVHSTQQHQQPRQSSPPHQAHLNLLNSSVSATSAGSGLNPAQSVRQASPFNRAASVWSPTPAAAGPAAPNKPAAYPVFDPWSLSTTSAQQALDWDQLLGAAELEQVEVQKLQASPHSALTCSTTALTCSNSSSNSSGRPEESSCSLLLGALLRDPFVSAGNIATDSEREQLSSKQQQRRQQLERDDEEEEEDMSPLRALLGDALKSPCEPNSFNVQPPLFRAFRPLSCHGAVH